MGTKNYKFWIPVLGVVYLLLDPMVYLSLRQERQLLTYHFVLIASLILLGCVWLGSIS